MSLVAIAVAFGFCFWQNHRLLHLVNSPLAHQTQQQVRDGHGPLGATYRVQLGARDVAAQLRTVVGVLAQQAPDAGGPSLARPRRRRSLDRDVTAAVGTAAGEPAGDARDRRAVHDHAHGDAAVRADPGDAGGAGTDLRLLHAGARARSAPAHQAAAVRAAVSVRRRGRVRLLRRAAGRPAVLPELQQRPVQRARAGEPVLQVRGHDAAGDGCPVPGPGRDRRDRPHGRAHPTTAAAQPPLRGRRVRAGRRACCPGDAITMLLETVPLYLLFEVGVLLAAIAERRSRRAEARTTPVASGAR